MDVLMNKVFIQDGAREGCRPYRLCYDMMMKRKRRNEELHQDRPPHKSYGMALSLRPRPAVRIIRMSHLRMAAVAFLILHS